MPISEDPTTGWKSLHELEGKALVSRINELFDQAHTSRRDPEVRWLVSMAMIEGFHYLKVDYASRRIIAERSTPPGEIRAKIDDILMRYEEAMGRFSEAPILPQVSPKGTDPKKWIKVRPTQILIDSLRTDSRYNFKKSYLNLISYLLVGGTGGIYVHWDKGQEMPIFEAVPSWELYPIPASARTDNQLTGIIRSVIVDREWVNAHYPDVLLKVTPRSFHDSSNGYGSYGGRGLQTEGYMVKYVFLKPDRMYPKGRVLILVESELVYDSGQEGLPAGIFPFAFVRYTPLPNYWWGMNFLYRVCNMNKELNRLFSNMVSSAELIANGGYVFVPSGIVDVSQLHKQKGGLIPYTSQPLNSEDPIQSIQPPRAGSELQTMFVTTKATLDDVTAQHEISRGQAPGRVDSGTGLSFLRDEDMTPLACVSSELQTAYQQIFNVALTLCKTFWTGPKRIAVLSDGDIPLERLMGPESIGTLEDMELSIGPILPQSKPFLLQQLDKLLQMGQLTPHQYKKGLAACGVRIPGMEDLISVDERKAEVENRILYNDGQTPGQIPEPLEIEDHAVHHDVIRRFMASFEFALTASEEVREAFEMHAQYHMEHLVSQGPGMGADEYDTDARDFDQQTGERDVSVLETDSLMEELLGE